MIKKKITVIFSTVMLLLSLAMQAQKADKLEFIKERSISKTYSAAGNSLSIDNSFGDLKVIAWDKNEIKVDVSIKVESSNQDMAERVFSIINVQESHTGNKVRFKTELKSTGGNDCKNCETRMHIDYEVRLPVTVALSLTNSFGNIELPDYRGPVSLTSKFGKLNTGNLADLKSITVEFGRAVIKSVSDLNATFKFSKIHIGSLSGNNKIDMEFCDSSSISLSKSLSSLSMNESYSTVNLRPADNLEASYSIRTSFGNFIDRTNIGIVRTDKPDRYGPDSKKEYEGKNGNGSVKVTVRSSFGKIILGEPKPEDMNKKTSKYQGTAAGEVI